MEMLEFEMATGKKVTVNPVHVVSVEETNKPDEEAYINFDYANSDYSENYITVKGNYKSVARAINRLWRRIFGW